MEGYERIHTNPLDSDKGIYFLTGNEALARAGLVSGVTYFSSYPGSPITGTSEVMIKAAKLYKALHAEYSINEPAALFGATGASWVGARTMVTMKHVGMHVSCDPIAYLGYTGTVGGLVLGVGTDPGATSSTGEFDVRHLNDAFHWIILEPSTVKEVYEFTLKAFEMSETWKLPVLLIMPAELCNQYGTFFSDGIELKSGDYCFSRDEKYINNGLTAVKHHQELLSKIKRVAEAAGSFLQLDNYSDGDTAIITSGCNYLAVLEALNILDIKNITVIKLGMTYPLPDVELARVMREYKTVLIAEELDGYLSKHLLAFVKKNEIDITVKSLNGEFLSAGNLSMDKLLKALKDEVGIYTNEQKNDISFNVPDRPGTFCPGCPHRGILYTLRKVCTEHDVYGGDIGCSSLPPYYSDWLTCMGSGLGIAHGVAIASNSKSRIYTSMGDSTFFHCGIPLLVNSIQANTDITVLILDNRWTAMTGHQPLPHTENENQISIIKIVESLGAKNVWEVDAYDLKQFREILMTGRTLKGVKIIVVKGECRLKYLQNLRKELKSASVTCKLNQEICHQCGECYKILGCPAIKLENGSYQIDEQDCGRCGICAEVCPNNSISLVKYVEVKSL